MIKYPPETIEKLKNLYINELKPVEEISILLDLPKRSIISKLSALGVYKRKAYTNKRGETPVKKSEYVAQLASILGTSADFLDSLEKVNKNVLELLVRKLKNEKSN